MTVTTPAVTGLSQAEVRERIQRGQVNQAPPEAGRSLAQILRANICTRFNAILGVLFVVVMIVGPPQDALFGVVLVVNTAIGIFQEIRAKRALDRLAILTAAQARVIRDGEFGELPVDQVVQDDVLELRTGDQVPVDARVLSADGLELDEALLTGEADSVAKAADDKVLSGSVVVAGSGLVRATGVGGEAYAARLQAQARQFSLIRSELQQGTNQILRLMTWVLVPVALLLVLSLFFRSHDSLADAVRESAAGVTGMVPEGLVLLTSLAFTMGAMRLARRRVLVQELAAIEGLARVDVLCVDKTGTLTQPGMRLVETQAVAGWPEAGIADAVAALVSVDSSQNGTMQALAERFTDAPGWTARAQVPFSSARKWSGVTFEGEGSWVLGAPSVVGGGRLPADVADAVATRESSGRRVLLLAHADGPLDPTLLEGGLPAAVAPAALLVLAEELRDETASTVRYLIEQGVTIKVMSGDAPRSVAAIAGRAGIPALGPPCDGYSLGESEEEVGAALAQSSVLGRVKPGQKLAGVKALQAAGHVVAMVGDGVNDVPALKQADLGIAMGSGSQASRSVARVVLLDGTFSAIPLMLAEGRRVIANIERVAGLFVTKTVYAALIAVVVGIAGISYPFFPRHLTIISTLTIGVPGFFLALAPGAPRARPGFTRRVLSFAVPAGVAAGAAALASYWIARGVSGVSVTEQRTATMLALFALGIWVLVLIAHPLNAWKLALIAAMVAGLVLLLAIPVSRRVFALQIPPASVLVVEGAIVLAAIVALTVWRLIQRSKAGLGPVGAGGPGGHAGGAVRVGVLPAACHETLQPGRAGQRDSRRHERDLRTGHLDPADLLGAHVSRRHAEPAAHGLHHRGARAGVGVEAAAGRPQLRMMRVAGHEPVIPVRDQVRGALPGCVVLPVAALVQRQRRDRQPRPPSHERHQRDDHHQVDQRSVAEDLAVVHPPVGIRMGRPEVHDERHAQQHHQHDRDGEHPPQVPHQLPVRHPRRDERREVRRVRHLVRPVDPPLAEQLEPGDDLAHDVVPQRLVQGVARVVKAVVRVQLVPVLHPDLPPVGQDQVRLQAHPRAGQLPHRVERLDVPGQVTVVVADYVDDLAASLGDGEQRRAEVLVRAQDFGGGRLAVPEQLDRVAGQHHGQRAGVAPQPLGQRLTRPPGYLGTFRRQVQVADHDDPAVGRDGHVEQVGDVGSRRCHGVTCSSLRPF